MDISAEAKRIMEAMTVVERMAPVGLHEQGEYVKAALYMHWPHIRAILLAVQQTGT